MALFDLPNLAYPTEWKEFSLDYKLFYVFEAFMALLCVEGDALSIQQELLATLLLVGILFSFSIRNRRRTNWRWPGVQANGVLNALETLVFAGTYEFAATALAPPSDPATLAIHLVGVGIFAFLATRSLNIVQPAKSEFLRECEVPGVGDPRPSSTPTMITTFPEKTNWKQAVRTAYGLAFHILWLDMVTFLYLLGVALRNGSSKPTLTQTDHMLIAEKYVQHSQKMTLEFLLAVYAIGMASGAMLGLILHFFFGVRLFPNMPTLQEWRERRKRN